MTIAKLSSVRFLIAVTATVVLAASVFGDRTWAQQPIVSSQGVNFDIRADKRTAPAGYLDRVAAQPSLRVALATGRAAGVARLQAEYGALDIVESSLLETLEVVGAKPGSGFLTGPTTDRVAAMQGFLSAHADAYGLSQDQMQRLELVANYVNPAGNMAWVEFEQRVNGLPVFQGLVRGGFTQRGELARVTGPLASGLDAASLPTVPVLTPARAVSLAAAHVGWNVPEDALTQNATDAEGRITLARGPMADDATAWLVYFPLAPGVARLAWAAEIWGDPDAFLVLLDADAGTVLFRKNLTNYQTQTASYTVYNDGSPAPMAPIVVLPGSGTQAPFIGRTTLTLTGNEFPNTFNNLGWMTDGTNVTDGNNVQAGIDRDGIDGVDAPVAGSPSRVFNFGYNPQADDPLTPAYQNGEVTDSFYWTNVYHDRLYLLGFTEAARNFQHDNFGRGGLAADRIRAEAQDSSGTNNANFSTPADGGRGRMQMFIFTGPTPRRSSGLDHDVLLHELTHGTSNRLHNNASGLGTQMSGGMGEGWSDFYARALLSNAGEDVNGIYSTGGWVTNQLAPGYVDNYYYGIRRFPYAVKTTVGSNGRPHNPLTLADIDPAQINLTNGAFPQSPIIGGPASEVHNVGEVWCMALLEVRARFITRLGFAAGNQRILQFVTDGMKLDPVNPTLLQGRDAILAAAAAGGGTAADTADIWAGFATRGMGLFATVNSATFAVSENFNVPGDVVPTFSINDVTVTEGNSGPTTATFTVTLATPSATTESRVSFATADGTATTPGTPFTAPGPMIVPAVGTGSPTGAPAAPYPLNLTVSGLPTSISRVRARLNSVTHTFAADMDVLLVGPGGQTVMLMSDVGGDNTINGINLTFDDGSPSMPTSTLATGTYAPTNLGAVDPFPAPAPAAPYGNALSVFNGTNPNGTWRLYVVDDLGGGTGTIGSLTLMFSTTDDDYQPTSGQLIFPPGGSTTQSVNVTINGDVIGEVNETFFVNLFDPINAFIMDAQGQGTILNDDGPPTPTVVTGGAGVITATSAILGGTANPNGLATTANFQYGTTTAYGLATPVHSLGSGTSPVTIAFNTVTGLACSTLYHFRATATNAGGTSNGADAVFTTGPCLRPAVTTGFASGFNATGATLNGTASPNGAPTTASFEYGLTATYGSTTPAQTLGSGGSPVAIGGGSLAGLTCDTVYHFRATATNAIGTTVGADATFSPPCATSDRRVYGVANDTNAAVVFNASTVATVATIPLPVASGYDVAVMPNQSLAFVARSTSIWIIDLTQNPPALATGINPIVNPIGGIVEDLSLTPDGRFLVVSDGSGAIPIGVINTATRTVVGTFSFLPDHNSVEVCDDGSVLVTSISNVIKRLTISSTGTLADTGQSLALPFAGPNNATCAPGGKVGVVVDFLSGDLRSFLINGMTLVSTQVLPGVAGGGINVAISPDGTRLFGRRSIDFLTAYSFNSTTGVIGPQLWSTNVAARPSFFGVDQMAVDPNGSRVFASTAGFVLALNASNGALNGSVAMVSPTGVGVRRRVRSVGDFDGDGKTDPAIYRPATGLWAVLNSGGNYTTSRTVSWGLSTDVPEPGDYDGDGKADPAIFRPSTGLWAILYSSTNYTTSSTVSWGLSTDLPVPGDYDGDGKTDPAIYRPSTGLWAMLKSSNGYTSASYVFWGLSTDVPMQGDYDGDGKADPAVFRQSTGSWYVLRSSTAYGSSFGVSWGLSSDVPVPGDYDGDGKIDPAVFRPSTGNWYVLQSSTNYTTSYGVSWGLSTDDPVPADFDGDGKTDPAIFRSSTGIWAILKSSTNYTTSTVVSWGLSTDTPLHKRP